MRISKRFFGVVLLAAVLLLASVVPVSAGTTRTAFTGSCGFLAGPPIPDVRMWYTGQNELHIRNDIMAMDCSFSDARLNGVYHAAINWDVKEYLSPFWYVIGHDYGQMSLVDGNGNLLWDGFRNSWYTAPLVLSGQVVLHGSGEYAGLTVIANISGDFATYYGVQFAGEIIDPGT